MQTPCAKSRYDQTGVAIDGFHLLMNRNEKSSIADRWHIVIVSPPAYQFSETFREIAETICYGLRRLGNVASIGKDIDYQASNIILGAHLLDEQSAQGIPERSIIYNFEQVHGNSKWIKPIYVELVRRFTCWDYSPRNIEMWSRYCPDALVVHVPLGYVPELSRISTSVEEDIDVLFYGVINERRARILSQLREAGLNVHAVTGLFGAARDALIARAKVILNVHFFETKIFELSRVSYLLANRKAVVAEVDSKTEIEEDLREAIAGADYAHLVDKCIELVFDDVVKTRTAEAGFLRFSQRDEAAILRNALSAMVTRRSPLDVPLPKRMNVGSGKGWDLEALNVDIDPMWRPDFIADLNRPISSRQVFDLGRFGQRELPLDCFEEIHASHVLEHLADLVTAMESFLGLLTEGGVLCVEVPYDLSHGAWQDPTHVRAFNERSWLYYTDWFWYLGWTEHRFRVDGLEYLLSDYGQSLTTTNTRPEDAIRIPRAVDAMRVRLRKVSLTLEEKSRVMQRWQD
jgi:hypothetical protein